MASQTAVPLTISASRTSSASASASATHDPDALPLKPKITPGMGVAGAFLMIAGATLTLIGIKNQSFHIFLSCALLASLSVTVLIIYIMNPPVPDAIQGAYMVAAVLTGAVFGAVSLIFKEITEGLVCLLGGFCLAMWFLVLSPGGLVHSTSGIATMIGVFSAVALSLSFSHYTRTYGLIACTAFSGSTATVMGIDCFSRVGLKEFWLYIWKLNDDTFPIDTDTYPMTRGIKVEIAAMIIIFVFGVLSQLKIWKIVKDRREKREQERIRQDEAKDEEDTAAGKQALENDDGERAEWEAEYGDRKEASYEQVGSGMGSSVQESERKGSVHVREREVHAIEMAGVPAGGAKSPKKHAKKPSVTERMVSQDSVQRVQEESQRDSNEREDLSRRSGSVYSRQEESVRDPFTNSGQASLRTRPSKESFHGAPPVMPLPFNLPQEYGNPEDKSQRQSPHNSDDAVYHQTGAAPLVFDFLGKGTSFDAPRAESRASSVAATAADEPDFADTNSRRVSRVPTPYDAIADRSRLSLVVPGSNPISRAPSQRNSMVETPFEENDEEALERETQEKAPFATPAQGKKQQTTDDLPDESVDSRSPQISDPSGGDDTASVAGSLRHQLPEKLSKVAMTYRTNEWAKHIADAEQPDSEEDRVSTSPGIQVDRAFAEEAAKPVRPVEEETIRVRQPRNLLSRNSSYAPSKTRFRSSKDRPHMSRQSSSATMMPIHSFQSGEPTALPPAARPSSAVHKSSTKRILSAPLLTQPLKESPVEEQSAAEATRNFSAPLNTLGTNNLLDQRNQMLNSRTTSTSFNTLDGSTPNLNLATPSDTASCRNRPFDAREASEPSRSQTPEGDNLTLAQRKGLMRQEQLPQRQSTLAPPISRRTSGTGSTANLIYDSHQPKRNNTVDTAKQGRIYNQWRQSLQAEAAARQPQWNEDSARQSMLNERRQIEAAQQRETARKVKRQSTRDSLLRTGALNDVHRQAMRKMQAKANGKYLG
ncbi:hypothetical protein MBLNU230_g2212t1 [Neophaeotheca triangularis]